MPAQKLSKCEEWMKNKKRIAVILIVGGLVLGAIIGAAVVLPNLGGGFGGGGGGGGGGLSPGAIAGIAIGVLVVIVAGVFTYYMCKCKDGRLQLRERTKAPQGHQRRQFRPVRSSSDTTEMQDMGNGRSKLTDARKSEWKKIRQQEAIGEAVSRLESGDFETPDEDTDVKMPIYNEDEDNDAFNCAALQALAVNSPKRYSKLDDDEDSSITLDVAASDYKKLNEPPIEHIQNEENTGGQQHMVDIPLRTGMSSDV